MHVKEGKKVSFQLLGGVYVFLYYTSVCLGNDRTMIKNYRHVATVEEFWNNILKQVHDKDRLHAGIKLKNIHG